MDAPKELWRRFRRTVHDAGILYSLLYVLRWALNQAVAAIEVFLLALERRNRLVAPWTISAHRFTIAENRAWWNQHDWSSDGEEWTPDSAWKKTIVERFIVPYVFQGSVVVEIGPGAGRWTEFLQPRASLLFLVDVSDRVLQLCRDRFSASTNVRYLLTNEPKIGIPDNSVDVVWAYDVFVHVNPIDARSYFQEFGRVLRAGSYAIIHHPGAPPRGGLARPDFRSELTTDMVLQFGRENDLELADQTMELVNVGDAVSIFRRRPRASE